MAKNIVPTIGLTAGQRRALESAAGKIRAGKALTKAEKRAVEKRNLVRREEGFIELGGQAGKAGAWLLPSGVLVSGQHYLKQLVNESPAYERDKDGRQRLVWKERDRNLGHDFWDCEVNGSAIAQMVVDQLPGNPGWDASKWQVEKPKRARGKRGVGPGGAVSPKPTADGLSGLPGVIEHETASLHLWKTCRKIQRLLQRIHLRARRPIKPGMLSCKPRTITPWGQSCSITPRGSRRIIVHDDAR